MFTQRQFAIAVEAVRRAAAKGIQLQPMPNAFSDDFLPDVVEETPKGHYIGYWHDGIRIIAVDDHRRTAGVYDDLVQDYVLMSVCILPLASEVPLDHPARNRSFVVIHYQ